MLDDASRWDIIHQKTYQQGSEPSSYAKQKEKLFPRGSLIVELGGGTGADAAYFLQQGHSVVLLDISTYALKVAKERAKKDEVGEKLVVKQVDFGLHQLPIKDSSIDIVYSRISLNYFGSKQTIKIFTDISRMLKPGGTCYLTFKSPKDKAEMEYLKNSASLYEPNVYIEHGQLRSRFTTEQLKLMLSEAGISEFSVEPLRELLPANEEGNQPTLYVNEVMFTK
jgi:ubiquinone/menaquinone biosynthesis C-methylase UbiE